MKTFFKAIFYIIFFPVIICWWIFKGIMKLLFICLGIAAIADLFD